jgi:hypothetical protein
MKIEYKYKCKIKMNGMEWNERRFDMPSLTVIILSVVECCLIALIAWFEEYVF